jgi:hypothetical protein
LLSSRNNAVLDVATGNLASHLRAHPEFDETPGKYPSNEGIYCRSYCPLHPQVHDVVFEGSPPQQPSVAYPQCLEGERACPPEDVGGVTGYAEYLEAIADPSHERHQEMLDWKGPFNPDVFKRDGFSLTRVWPVDPRIKRNVLFWPKIERTSDIALQADAIAKCLQSVYRTGGWCLYFDEVRYITDTLGLQRPLEVIWLQGRALKLSVLAGTQRPAWIPREAYSEASHLFLWRSTNRYDLKRLEDASNVDTKNKTPTIGRSRFNFLGGSVYS